MNSTPKEILKNIFVFFLGLTLLSFGTYLTIQAGIGVSSWDCLALGTAGKLGVQYGDASLIISVTVILMDIILKEKIGLGTVLNGIFCGKIVDVFNWLDIVPMVDGKLLLSIGLVVVGMIFECFGVIYYMKPSLGCGPRDTFKVGIGRHLRRIKIGTVGIGINMIVLLCGWLLGGPVGIGTVMNIFLYGVLENIINALVKFEPRDLKHQDIIETFRVLFRAKNA